MVIIPAQHLVKVPCPTAQADLLFINLFDSNRGPSGLESSTLPTELFLLLNLM